MDSAPLLRSLAMDHGTRISLYMPTHRHGSETLSDAGRFKTLLKSLHKEIEERKIDAETEHSLIDRITSLVSQSDFWQHRSEGLAILADADSCLHFDLPYSVIEEWHIGNQFRLRQIIPFLTDNHSFYLLALSKNSVRLFEGSRYSFAPILPPDLPNSIDEALQHEDPERQLQMKSVGGGHLSFHGHGAGDEIDKEALERFLRVVDRSVANALNGHTEPLVLAAVPYFLPIYESITSYPNLFGHMIEGSPERSSANDLHDAAWKLLEPHFDIVRSKELKRLHDLTGTGLLTNTIEDIVEASTAGRIQTLYLPSTTTSESDTDDDRMNRLIVETLSRGGSVSLYPSGYSGESCPIAVLRF
jgi:hypothetical protein